MVANKRYVFAFVGGKMARQCSYANNEECNERAIAGFYVGEGKVETACPEHFDEVYEKHPVSVPFILDDMNEKIVEALEEHNNSLKGI